MSDSGLQVVVDGGVARLTVARPETLNSLTVEVLRDAVVAVERLSTDPAVRVVVITGEGRAFSSGAALGAVSNPSEGQISTLDAGNALVEAIVSAPKPVVAAVNGLAAGIGATIALSCDLTLVRRSAYFLLAFVNIGLMPDGGATALVPAAIGRARASRMALLGERISAERALEWGLVSHVVDDADFDAELATLVDKLASGPTVALARTKAALADATLALLRQAHDTERAGQLALFETADHQEGVAAFREKRAATFLGR